MPEIYNFEKKINKEPYSEGAEKIIYLSDDNPNEVIAVIDFNFSESPERIKARYYLSKILHLLFPQNIPDVHFVCWGDELNPNLPPKPVLIIERKFLDKIHNILNGISSSQDENSMYLKGKLRRERNLELQIDQRYIDLNKQMSDLGINLDPNPLNFGYDEYGNLVYVDNSFIPWYIGLNNEIVSLGYDPEKIKHKINEKLSGFTRLQALSYLERLEKLRLDYENRVKRSRK